MLRKKIRSFYGKTLNRIFLEKMIKKYAHMVKGKVIDIGSKNRRYDNFFLNSTEITAVDKVPNHHLNIKYSDVTKLNFSNNSFDAVVCFEVLEYVNELEKAISEVKRVLDIGGIFLFSVPFLSPIHGIATSSDPNTDTKRLTIKGWDMLLKKQFTKVEIIAFGNRLTLMYSIVFSIIRKKKHWRLLLFPLLKPLQLFLLKNHRHSGSDPNYPLGYFVFCAK